MACWHHRLNPVHDSDPYSCFKQSKVYTSFPLLDLIEKFQSLACYSCTSNTTTSVKHRNHQALLQSQSRTLQGQSAFTNNPEGEGTNTSCLHCVTGQLSSAFLACTETSPHKRNIHKTLLLKGDLPADPAWH